MKIHIAKKFSSRINEIKNHNINIFRFVASLMVVFFHLNAPGFPVLNWYRSMVSYGWLGVPIFFVISGYCIIASAYRSYNIKNFLIKRFFRIFPPFWASLVVVYCSAAFQKIYTSANSVEHLPKTLTAFAANLTLTTAPFSKIPTINWVYWSLTCEVIFYLIISVGLLFNKKQLLSILIVVSAISAFSPKATYGAVFFLNHWPAFGLGLSIYYFYKIVNWQSALNFGLLFLINAYGIYHNFSERPEYLIATSIAIFSICIGNQFPIKQNLVSKLGQQSYSVYLIHVPIGVFIFGLFKNEYIKAMPYLNMLYDIFVFIIISIIASVMFSRVEKPWIQYGKTMLKKRSISSTESTQTT